MKFGKEGKRKENGWKRRTRAYSQESTSPKSRNEENGMLQAFFWE